jgi:hypothetical protein
MREIGINFLRGIPEKEILCLALIFLVVSIVSASGLVIYLKSNLLYGFILLAFYFSGGVRFMPWRSRIAKSFSLGVFVGASFGAAIYYNVFFIQLVR